MYPAASNVSTAPLRSSRPSRASSVWARWNPSMPTSRARSPSCSTIRPASVDFPPPGGPQMPSSALGSPASARADARASAPPRESSRAHWHELRQASGLTTALCNDLSLAKSSSARPYSCEAVAMGDEPVGPHPAGAQRGDRGRERGDLGERALDRDLATEEVVRVHREGVVGVRDAVDHHGAAVPGEADALLADASRARRLDHVVVAALGLLVELARRSPPGSRARSARSSRSRAPRARSSWFWLGEATVTCATPPEASSCASSSPVAPEPRTSAVLPGCGRSVSRPWSAQAVGSAKTATSGIEAVDVEDDVGRHRDQLGEAAVAVGADARQVAAQELAAAPALVAAPAAHVGVDRDPLPGLEGGDLRRRPTRPCRRSRGRARAGTAAVKSPSWMCLSVPQSPVWWTRICTSFGPGSVARMSSTAKTRGSE